MHHCGVGAPLRVLVAQAPLLSPPMGRCRSSKTLSRPRQRTSLSTMVSFRVVIASPWIDLKTHFLLAPPSPLELNEFSNVFDFDFSTSHNYPTSEPRSSTLPTPLSRKRASRNSPPRSPRNVHSPESDISREPSPVNSDSNSKRRFPCQIPGCSRRFTSQYTLKVHMEAHKPKPRVSFPCTLGCSERFSRQHDRLRHEVAKHGKVCEFLCDDCGRFFSSSKTLGNHKCPVPQGGTRWVNN